MSVKYNCGVTLERVKFPVKVPPAKGRTPDNLLTSIAAFEAIFALSIIPLLIRNESPPLLTVISPLSPSSIPPPPDISATFPLSFFVNIFPKS